MVYGDSQAAILSYVKEKVIESSVQPVLEWSILNWEMINEVSRAAILWFLKEKLSGPVYNSSSHEVFPKEYRFRRFHSLIRQEKSENLV